MKKDILIEKSSKYISITSKLIGRLRFLNVEQEVYYLDLNISYSDLGKKIREKLSESREVSEEEFMYYWKNKEIMVEFTKNENKKIFSKYGYKNQKELYKDLFFLDVSIHNEALFIEPMHQNSLGGYTAASDKNGQAIEFKYPLNLTDEELGKATMEAFKYCTSIYNQG